jgi:hypothetical protein
MSKKEEITALHKEIKKKERDLYRANKEVNNWNTGRHRPPSNAKMTNLFVETSKKEIADLNQQLVQLEKGE